MSRTFRLQEKLFHYVTIPLRETLGNFESFAWKKLLNGLIIPINHTIQIPFVFEKPFYAIRIVPHFRKGDVQISIPTIRVYGSVNPETSELVIENEHYSMWAIYDPLNPGYKIKNFEGTYDFIASIFEDIFLDIQVCQSLDINPLNEVDSFYENEKYGYDFFKDGITNAKEIIPNKSCFNLNLENITLDTLFSTYNRTAFFSAAYPLHRTLLLSSIIPVQKNSKKRKVPGITYDDGFYGRLWVPTYRSYAVNLNFSWSMQKDEIRNED